MKIAIIGSRGYPYVYSGYETFLRELLGHLNNVFEFHIYCHRQLFDERPKQVNGVHLHYIPAIQKKSLSQLSNSLLSTIHALFMDYDLVLYVNTANGPFGMLTKLFGIQSAIITDGLEWERPKWAGLGAKYFLWASKQATRFMDVLISDSVEMKKIYLKKFGVDSEVIAYGANPIDGEEKKSSDKYRAFCDKNDLKGKDYYLIVGRLVPDNNADLLIEGFHNSNSEKKLIVVGDVPYQDEWADKVKGFASDRIIFTGYVRDQEYLTDLFLHSYVYLHGHEHGGTNPSLLTALAKHCAVLALDTRFSREVLDDGKYGFYFDKKLESVARMIDYLDESENEVQALKKRASDRIYNNYTWEKIANQYEELFKKIAK